MPDCPRCGDHTTNDGLCVPCEYEREQSRISSKRWYDKQSPEAKAAHREYCRQHYKKNKEKMDAYRRQWYRDHPDYHKKRYAANREKIAAYQREYYRKNRERILKRKKELGWIAENKSLA